MTVVACVILQCILCFYECRCMSDGVFIQLVCQILILWQSRLKSARGLSASIVFVNISHSSNEDHVKLDFHISLSM